MLHGVPGRLAYTSSLCARVQKRKLNGENVLAELGVVAFGILELNAHQIDGHPGVFAIEILRPLLHTVLTTAPTRNKKINGTRVNAAGVCVPINFARQRSACIQCVRDLSSDSGWSFVAKHTPTGLSIHLA